MASCAQLTRDLSSVLSAASLRRFSSSFGVGFGVGHSLVNGPRLMSIVINRLTVSSQPAYIRRVSGFVANQIDSGE